MVDSRLSSGVTNVTWPKHNSFLLLWRWFMLLDSPIKQWFPYSFVFIGPSLPDHHPICSKSYGYYFLIMFVTIYLLISTTIFLPELRPSVSLTCITDEAWELASLTPILPIFNLHTATSMNFLEYVFGHVIFFLLKILPLFSMASGLSLNSSEWLIQSFKTWAFVSLPVHSLFGNSSPVEHDYFQPHSLCDLLFSVYSPSSGLHG